MPLLPLLALSLLSFSVARAQEAVAAVPQISFAVIGDYGTGSGSESAVARLVGSWDVDFVITTGDNYYRSARGFGGSGFDQYDNSVGKDYCAYLQAVAVPDRGRLDCPPERQSQNANRFFPAVGNHDRTGTQGSGLTTYLNYFTLPGEPYSSSSGSERYYDFVEGPVHFFAIDSDTARRDANDLAAQQMWLRDQLQSSDSPWNIVYFHHPAYSSSIHGSDVIMQWPFAEWGADVVFQGHDHVYERIFRDGIPYFVSGNGGKDLYEFDTVIAGSSVRYSAGYGALLVTAGDEFLNFEAWAIEDEGEENSITKPHLVDLYHLPLRQERCHSLAVVNCPPPAIGGKVWIDANANGLQDPDERLRASVRVDLWEPGPDGQVGGGDDRLAATTYSSSQGYGFYDLEPDPYFVQFGPSVRFRFTKAHAENDAALDSDADPATAASPLFSYTGQPFQDLDAGLVPDPPQVQAPLMDSWIDRLSVDLPSILAGALSVALLAITLGAVWQRRRARSSRG